MAAPSAETLQRIESETGLPAPTLEKVLRLLDLLQAIADDSVLSSRVALKGGTALNVFQLPLDRLSVDIDLNYIGALPRAEIDAWIANAVEDCRAGLGHLFDRTAGEA